MAQITLMVEALASQETIINNAVIATKSVVWERSHMTSAAEGGGGFEMLTVADRGRGSKPC